jgi:DNA polymerase-3 subunit gamma/tau
MILGQKNLLAEIEIGASLLEHHRTDPRRFFLLRAVKKLLKRFDPILWEGDEAKLKGTSGPLSSLQDDLEVLYPAQKLPEEKGLISLLERISSASKALSDALPSTGIPIHQIRKASAWARTTTSGAPKFVLLENADKMAESPRNALLKILEEPPSNTWFFLLTSQKGAILPTLLSRLRAFSFAQRSTEEQQSILGTLFHSTPGSYVGLADYFQASETHKKGLYDELASQFLEALGQPIYPLEAYGKFWSEEDNFRVFLEALVAQADARLDLTAQERFFELLTDVRGRRDTYNLGPALLIETLFYRARAADISSRAP